MSNEAIEKIKAIQKVLFPNTEKEWDGNFGPKSKAALAVASDVQEMAIQRILGVTPDGIFGKNSKAALTNVLSDATTLNSPITPAGEGWIDAYASSFADLGDVKAFNKCKQRGNSDKFCFKVGDNGIGYRGMKTATEDVCIAAIRARDMAKYWGSMDAANGKPIEVAFKDIIQKGMIGDFMSPGLKATIDTNPGFHKAFNLHAPFIVKVKWRPIYGPTQ